MAVKEKALRRLADKLNAAGVRWAIGAGWLLAHHGVMDTWHDIDIIVDGRDAQVADKVLSRLGMRSEAESYGGFHAAYHFDGADIDVMADCAIARPEGTYHLRFDERSVAGETEVLGAQVKMMHLEDWLLFYALCGRESRVRSLEDYFQRNGVRSPERFALAFEEALPEDVQGMIQQLVKEQ